MPSYSLWQLFLTDPSLGSKALIQATLHQLKVFEATARNGSFTRAAKELFITQPTV